MKIISTFLLFSFLFFVNIGQGQSLLQADKKAIKCYNKGKAALSTKDYAKAEKHFLKATERSPDVLEFKRELATTYLNTNRPQAAINLFEQIMKTDSNFDPKVAYTLYKMCDDQGDTEKAIRYLKIYNEQLPEGHKRKSQTAQQLRAITLRDSLMSNPVSFKPEKLDAQINTDQLEYLPAETADQSMLVFTRRLNNQEDIYVATKLDGEYTDVRPIKEINTSSNEGAHCISQDGKLMILTKENRNSRGNFDLYYSAFRNGKWSEPKSIGNNINTPAWESQPSLSADGKTLYFSSNREGGYGKSDIYKSTLKDRVWQQPVNLGPIINTSGNEESPFIHPDDQTLYFRSDQHPGMGSFDIFFAKKNLSGWTNVQNIGYPINTVGQEGALFVSLDGSKAYYASDGETKGNVDIYSFEIPDHLKPERTSYVKFKVLDADTKSPLKADLKIIDLIDEANMNVFQTDASGEILTVISEQSNYGIYIEKDGYLFYSDNLDFDNNINQQEIEKVIELQAIKPTVIDLPKKSEPIVLKNIFFESGASTLLPSSNQEIDKLKQLMTDNDEIKIEIVGHTDDVGSEADNQSLSEARAQSVKAALVSRGISSQRITAIGRGESQPIADNNDEAGRALNRRTEFAIIR